MRPLRYLLAMLALVPLLAFGNVRDDIRADMTAGRWHDADSALTKVIKEHPANAQAHYWMAQVKEHEGDLAAARAHLNEAKSLKPDLSFAGNSLAVEELERRLQAPARVQAPVQHAAPATEASHGMLFWLLAGGITIVVLTLLMRLFRRSSDDQFHAETRRQFADALKQLETELRDADKAIDARADWTPEQKFAYADRVSQAQGDVAKAHYALPRMTDFSSVQALIVRVRDLTAEIRGEEKPSLRQPPAGYASQGNAEYAPAPASGISGTGAVLTGVLAGAALGSLLSSSPAEARSAELASAGRSFDPTRHPDDSMSAVDFGRDDNSEDWSLSPDDIDSGTDSGGDW